MTIVNTAPPAAKKQEAVLKKQKKKQRERPCRSMLPWCAVPPSPLRRRRLSHPPRAF